MDVNQELLKVQKEWIDYCITKNVPKDNPNISDPFCYSVTNEYINSTRKIMIVGQECVGENKYQDECSFEQCQKWSREYLESQLDYGNMHKYNKSPFWNMFRNFKKNGVEPAWNNMDKFHLVIDEKSRPLNIEIKNIVDAPYGKDEKSLIKREIEMTKPNVVIFVIGPYYFNSLAISLEIHDKEIWKRRPTRKNPCVEITDYASLGCLAFWSYHPAYLNRIKELNTVVDMIIGRIKIMELG